MWFSKGWPEHNHDYKSKINLPRLKLEWWFVWLTITENYAPLLFLFYLVNQWFLFMVKKEKKGFLFMVHAGHWSLRGFGHCGGLHHMVYPRLLLGNRLECWWPHACQLLPALQLGPMLNMGRLQGLAIHCWSSHLFLWWQPLRLLPDW